MTDTARPISTDRLRELATIAPSLSLTIESASELRSLASSILQLRADLEAARAETRREQDARADLRVELDQERRQHKANIEGFESALVQERHEKSILEQVEAELRAERDAARSDLVKAMQTLELNAATGPCLNVSPAACYCAGCGRMRGDGRRGPNRGWRYVVADLNSQHRFSIRIAFCRRCLDDIEARAKAAVARKENSGA